MFNENVKHFLYGYLLGTKPEERERQPVEVPVEFISIAYDFEYLLKGEIGLLEASIFPSTATFKEIEWESSDPSVMTVTKVTETICQVTAVDTGTVTITARACDGNGGYGSVILNVRADEIFSSITVSKNINGIGDERICNSLIELNYTPTNMDGSKIKLEIDGVLSGEDSPYVVENTMFDNVKLIRNTFYNDHPLNGYCSYKGSTTSDEIRYNIVATDGSGIRLDRRTLKSGSFYSPLYGSVDSTRETGTMNLFIGCTASLYDNLFYSGVKNQCYKLKDTKLISIYNEDAIEIDGRMFITGKKLGQSVIKAELPYGKQFELTINIVDKSTINANYGVTLRDCEGLGVRSFGGLINKENKYYLVAGSSTSICGGKIELTGVGDSSKAKINKEDGSISIIGNGTTKVYYKLTYPTTSGLLEKTSDITVGNQGTGIKLGKCESEFIREGIVVLYAIGEGGIYYTNGNNHCKINLNFNGNKARLLKIVTADNSRLNTVNYIGDSAVTNGGTITYYQFEKLVSEPVAIGFTIGNFSSTYKEIII